MTTAKRSQRKSDRSGKSNSCVTNIAEPHGDVQPPTILTGQMPGKEDRMDDYGQGLAAGNEASCERENEKHDCVDQESSHQGFVNIVNRLIGYLIAGIWRNPVISIVTFGTTCLIVLHKVGTREQTGQKPRRIPYAGTPGSEMVFVNANKVPDKDQKKWLRTQLREHLAATSERLLIFVPVPLMNVLLADDDSLEDHRQAILQSWKEYQNEHWSLCETSQLELMEFNELTGFVSNTALSGEYVDEYTLLLKTFATATLVQTGMPCIEICSRIRKGQMLSAETQNGCTGNAVFDGAYAGRYLDMTHEDIEEAGDRFPEIFLRIGWGAPDEDEDAE